MAKHPKILFVGGGAMGAAIVQGLLEKDAAQPTQISVVEPMDARRQELVLEFGLTGFADISDVTGHQDVAVLCLKPQVFTKIGAQIGEFLHPQTLLVSIMAGTSVNQLCKATRLAKVVRAMPNTPAQVLAGMTVWTCTEDVSNADQEIVGTLFDAIGTQWYTAHEDDLDRATAINGSGPGFLFLILEAFIDAGVHIGFSREVATQLAVETFYGTAKLQKDRPELHPAVQRNNVTSPAGTTAAGLHKLEEAGLRAAIVNAVEAAFERSRALGG